jgi:hypothetical protein
MPAPRKTRTRTPTPRPNRGRPHKYGQPAQVVAVTLPKDTVATLRRLDADIGWAIVTLVNASGRAARRPASSRDAELVEIGSGQALIVVPTSTLKLLEGVQAVPLTDGQAFLALEPGRGLADVELAVTDRLEDTPMAAADAEMLTSFLAQLRQWRKDRRLKFTTRTIIIVARKAR